MNFAPPLYELIYMLMCHYISQYQEFYSSLLSPPGCWDVNISPLHRAGTETSSPWVSGGTGVTARGTGVVLGVTGPPDAPSAGLEAPESL